MAAAASERSERIINVEPPRTPPGTPSRSPGQRAMGIETTGQSRDRQQKTKQNKKNVQVLSKGIGSESGVVVRIALQPQPDARIALVLAVGYRWPKPELLEECAVKGGLPRTAFEVQLSAAGARPPVRTEPGATGGA